MSDIIPKPGDKDYKKRRTLKLEGFNEEEYYAIVSHVINRSHVVLIGFIQQESDRLEWMEKNWKKHVKTTSPSDGPDYNKKNSNPIPSSSSKNKENNEILTMGQRIFKTRLTCPPHNQPRHSLL